MSPRLSQAIARLTEADRTFVELTRLVPIDVAAAYLDLTISSLRGHVARGRIRTHKIAGRIYFGDSELDRFAERRRTTAPLRQPSPRRGARPFQPTPRELEAILASTRVIQPSFARTLAEVLGDVSGTRLTAARQALLRPN